MTYHERGEREQGSERLNPDVAGDKINALAVSGPLLFRVLNPRLEARDPFILNTARRLSLTQRSTLPCDPSS